MPATENSQGWFIYLLFVPIVLLACIQLLWVTALGPGVHEDSYSYMDTAWSFLHGYGFLRDGKPMTHFTPGYPMLLAFSYIVDGNLVQAARWLHVLLYGINMVLIGVAAYTISERSVLALLIAPVVVMLSGELLVVYSTAASESPFIALALASFILLSMHIKDPRQTLLLTAAVLLGLAMVTRYVGITLLPAVIASLWLTDRQPRLYRIRDCFLLSVVSSVPLAAWIVRNLILVGNPTDRTPAFHPISLHDLKVLVSNLCNFFFPGDFSPWFKVAVLVSIAAVAIVQLLRQQTSVAAKTLLAVLAIFCAVYISFLFVSMSFIDASTEFEYRILAPVAVFILAAAVAVCFKIASTADRTWVRWLSGAFVFSVIGANAPEHWRMASDLHRNGYYYSSRKWRDSETLAFVRSVPQPVTLYSNQPHAIGYLLGRRARMLPDKVSPLSLIPVKNHPQLLGSMCDDVARNGAMVVYFKSHRWHLPTAEELQAACSFTVSHRLADGLVFGIKKEDFAPPVL